MVFRFCPQILEDDLLHKSLHQVPVLHYPVTDGPLGDEEGKLKSVSQKLDKTTRGSSFLSYLCWIRRFVDGFVPNEEVQVIDASHHPALGLVSNLGRFFDCDTWRCSKITYVIKRLRHIFFFLVHVSVLPAFPTLSDTQIGLFQWHYHY